MQLETKHGNCVDRKHVLTNIFRHKQMCWKKYTELFAIHMKDFILTVFALTHLPETRDKYNWIRTSENYERICLNK